MLENKNSTIVRRREQLKSMQQKKPNARNTTCPGRIGMCERRMPLALRPLLGQAFDPAIRTEDLIEREVVVHRGLINGRDCNRAATAVVGVKRRRGIGSNGLTLQTCPRVRRGRRGYSLFRDKIGRWTCAGQQGCDSKSIRLTERSYRPSCHATGRKSMHRQFSRPHPPFRTGIHLGPEY